MNIIQLTYIWLKEQGFNCYYYASNSWDLQLTSKHQSGHIDVYTDDSRFILPLLIYETQKYGIIKVKPRNRSFGVEVDIYDPDFFDKLKDYLSSFCHI